MVVTAGAAMALAALFAAEAVGMQGVPVALAQTPPPPTCSLSLGSPSLNASAGPGGWSSAAELRMVNTGSLDVGEVYATSITPWYVDPAGDAPYVGPRPQLPARLTALNGSHGLEAMDVYYPLADGIRPGEEARRSLVVDLSSYPALLAGTLVQHSGLEAECMPPPAVLPNGTVLPPLDQSALYWRGQHRHSISVVPPQEPVVVVTPPPAPMPPFEGGNITFYCDGVAAPRLPLGPFYGCGGGNGEPGLGALGGGLGAWRDDPCGGSCLPSVSVAERHIKGDTIAISGAVDTNHTLPHDVSIMVVGPGGQAVGILQATPNAGNASERGGIGAYAASIVADGPNWRDGGHYEVRVQHSIQKASASFEFFAGDGGGGPTTGWAESLLPLEAAVSTPFAEVTFPAGVTAYAPAGWSPDLRAASHVPEDERVQNALAYDGSGRVSLQRVAEVGGGEARIAFDMPVRILLDGQGGGRAFYIDGAGGAIEPIDAACAADDAARVHRQLGGAGECQMDSDGGGKIIYTYHLTRFGTALPEHAVPPPSYHTCSARLETQDLGASASPGGRSPPVRQMLINSGSLPFAHVELGATPWRTDPGGGARQDGIPAPLPASATEVGERGAGGSYAPVSNGTAVAHGLGGGDVAQLWFRLNLVPHGEVQANSTMVQHMAYLAECGPP